MIKQLLKHKALLSTTALLGLVVIVFSISQLQMLNKAHSTFENYYAFRGCIQLIIRTPNYGICRTSSGQVIKIVLYHGKWYLDGDLPINWYNHLI